jgi:hypothetical protein
VRQLEEAGDSDAAAALGVDFEWALDDGQLYLMDNGESGNVAAFIEELICLGYAQEPVAIHWADSCSRPRPDTFTGGAALVTRRRTYWFILPELVEKKADSIARRRRTVR